MLDVTALRRRARDRRRDGHGRPSTRGVSLDDADARAAAARLVPAGHARDPATSPSAARSPSDIHGKNHHLDGTLLPTTSSRSSCSRRRRRPLTVDPDGEPDAFWATAGGHGPHRRGPRGDAAAACRSRRPASRVDTERARDLDDVHGADGVEATTATATRSRGSTASPRGAARAARCSRAATTRRSTSCRRERRERPLDAAAARLARRARRGCRTGCSTAARSRAFNELWFRKAPAARAQAAGVASARSSSRSTGARLEPHLRLARLPAVPVRRPVRAPRTPCAPSSSGSARAARRRSSPCSSASAPGDRAAVVPDARAGRSRSTSRPPPRARPRCSTGSTSSSSTRAAASTWPRTRACAPSCSAAMYPQLDEWRAVRARARPARRRCAPTWPGGSASRR